MLTTDVECLARLGRTPSTATESELALVASLRPAQERLVKKFVGYNIELRSHTEYHPLISTRPSVSQGYTEDEEILAYEGSPQGARPIRQGRGNSRDVLRLYNIPLRSVTTIHEDPNAWLALSAGLRFPSTTLLVEGRDFQGDWDATDSLGADISKTGFLYRQGGIWSLQARSVKVVYQAGYTALELAEEYCEFREAVFIAVTKAVKQAILLGLGTDTTKGLIKISESHEDYSVTYQAPLGGIEILQNDLPRESKVLLEEHIRYSKYM